MSISHGVRAGEKLPTLRTGRADAEAFSLHGSGVRRKFGLKLYESSLYTVRRYADGGALLEANEPVVVRLRVTSPLFTKKRMARMLEAATTGAPGEDRRGFDGMLASIDTKIGRGDVVDFVYEPNVGTRMDVNGKHKATIEGTSFKRTLFGIWFGAKPVDTALRDAMLAKGAE